MVFAEFKFGYKKVRNSCLWIALALIWLVLISVTFNKQPLFILCVLPALTISALRSLKNQFPRSPCSSTLPRRPRRGRHGVQPQGDAHDTRSQGRGRQGRHRRHRHAAAPGRGGFPPLHGPGDARRRGHGQVLRLRERKEREQR